MPATDSPGRPGHRRTVSLTLGKGYLSSSTGTSRVPSSMNQEDHDSADLPPTKTSSRFMSSVKRSIGSFPKKRGTEFTRSSSYGMISTPAERNLPTSTRYRNYTPSRPTIEQIAMGLHTSRTPHLRPLNNSPTNSRSRRSASPIVLPPPPARSSLKQPISTPVTLIENDPASASSSTLASTQPPTRKLATPISSFKSRMARLLPRSRISSAPPTLLSSASSSPRTSTELPTPKKAVRFSISTEA